MDWIVGITTVISIELTMRKYWWGFLVSAANQALWTVFIIMTAQWGLLPLNIMMYFMNLRAAYVWYKMEKGGVL